MNNESNENEFILSSFLLRIDTKQFSKQKKELCDALANLHATHAELDLEVSKSISELYKIMIHILREYIAIGSASKEQKEILEKLKILTKSQENAAENNINLYNEASTQLINALNNMDIK